MQKISWRLGLDLGTDSIGWAAWALDNDGEPVSLMDLGSRIFSDGRDEQTKEPLAVERRLARQQRRQLNRRKMRKHRVFRVLQLNALFPDNKEEAAALKAMDPYRLRALALDQILEPYELGRALFNLSCRRGFLSNRKSPQEDKEATATQKSEAGEKVSQNQMIENLQEEIYSSGCRTLGEWLYKKADTKGGKRFIPGRSAYYPSRQLYKDEFEAIRQKQSEDDCFSDVDWEAIAREIFFQRPLRPQKRGVCEQLEGEVRTFKAMPSSHKKRILQEVANLRFVDAGKERPLSPEQFDKVVSLLEAKRKVPFKAIRKALGLPDGVTFNLERGGVRDDLKGNTTAVLLRRQEYFGSLWDRLTLEVQDKIVQTMIEADEDEDVLAALEGKEFATLTEGQRRAVAGEAATFLEGGTTALSCKIQELLVAQMQAAHEAGEEPLGEYDVLERIKRNADKLGVKFRDKGVEQCDLLPYYGQALPEAVVGAQDAAEGADGKPLTDELRWSKIANPTVHAALNQMRVVVNALIRRYGKPAQVAVELGRELKASRDAKVARSKLIKDNQKRNDAINTTLREVHNIQYPNRSDRLKFKLWEELAPAGAPRRCLYCGKVIAGAELFGPNIEVEHILPFGRTLCDAAWNKTVAHKSCNAVKGEKSPFEVFGSNPPGFSWDGIQARAASLRDYNKRSCFTPGAMGRFEKESGFIARQLTDNAYIARIALRYLKAVCANVWSVNGGMTKLLRDKWNIDSILKRRIGEAEIAHFGLSEKQIGEYKKNRHDHRHHALDAVVIGLTSRSLVREVSRLSQVNALHRIQVPPLPISRQELEERVRRIVVSFKPEHGVQGKLFKETNLGKIKRPYDVAPKDLAQDDIPRIVDDAIRAKFESDIRTGVKFATLKKAWTAKYKTVQLWRDIYVKRVPLVSLDEKRTEKIIDTKLKEDIKSFNEAFAAAHAEMKFADMLVAFSNETGVRRVRIENHDQTAVAINRGSWTRYLATEDYFASQVFRLPPKKAGGKTSYQAVYIRRTDFDREGKPRITPPEAGAVAVSPLIHKGDYLEFTHEGKMYKGLVKGYSATQNKLNVLPIFTTTDCKDWLVSTAERMSEPCWKENTGANYISVNVLFGEMKAHVITVNPLGKVHRIHLSSES